MNREAGELRVASTRRKVEKEAGCSKRAEIKTALRGQRLERFAQRVQRYGFFDSRQREVRRVGALLYWNTKLCDGLPGRVSKGAQRLAAVDPRPKDARAALIREPAEASHCDIDRIGHRRGPERALHLIQSFLRPVADKFSGDVQVLGAAPVQLGQRFETLQQRAQAFHHILGDVDRGEQSHTKELGYQFTETPAARVLCWRQAREC